MNNKTFIQKLYSFFGFWKYYMYDSDGNKYKIWYWCCFPFKFYRKFDLIKIKCKNNNFIKTKPKLDKEKVSTMFRNTGNHGKVVNIILVQVESVMIIGVK